MKIIKYALPLITGGWFFSVLVRDGIIYWMSNPEQTEMQVFLRMAPNLVIPTILFGIYAVIVKMDK